MTDPPNEDPARIAPESSSEEAMPLDAMVGGFEDIRKQAPIADDPAVFRLAVFVKGDSDADTTGLADDVRKDPKAAASDRLRAMEQLESRALGKPKEKVAHEAEEPEVLQELREMTPEQRRLLLRQWNEGDVEEAAEH
jgi:hypothetical protein